MSFRDSGEYADGERVNLTPSMVEYILSLRDQEPKKIKALFNKRYEPFIGTKINTQGVSATLEKYRNKDTKNTKPQRRTDGKVRGSDWDTEDVPVKPAVAQETKIQYPVGTYATIGSPTIDCDHPIHSYARDFPGNMFSAMYPDARCPIVYCSSNTCAGIPFPDVDCDHFIHAIAKKHSVPLEILIADAYPGLPPGTRCPVAHCPSNPRPAIKAPTVNCEPSMHYLGDKVMFPYTDCPFTSCGFEKCGVIESPSVPLSVPQSVLSQNICLQNPALNGTTIKDIAVKGTAVKDTAAKGTPVNGTVVEGTVVKDTVVKHTAVKDAATKGTVVKGTVVKNTAVKDAAAKTRVAKSTIVKKAFAKHEGVAASDAAGESGDELVGVDLDDDEIITSSPGGNWTIVEDEPDWDLL